MTSLSKDDRIKLLDACKENSKDLEDSMQTWANSYANEYANQKYNDGFGKGELAGFGKGRLFAERETKFLAMQNMLEDGIDMGAVVKYLHISKEDLAFYITELEKRI